MVFFTGIANDGKRHHYFKDGKEISKAEYYTIGSNVTLIAHNGTNVWSGESDSSYMGEY